MRIKKLFIIFAFAFAAIYVERASAQSLSTLKAVGNGEKVLLTVGRKSKNMTLEGTTSGNFTAGGDARHRYTTLISIQKDAAFYIVAKFRSGAPMPPLLSR